MTIGEALEKITDFISYYEIHGEKADVTKSWLLHDLKEIEEAKNTIEDKIYEYHCTLMDV